MWWDKKCFHLFLLHLCAVFYAQRGDVQCTTAHTACMAVVVGARARAWISPPTCADIFHPTGLRAVGVRIDNLVCSIRSS